MTTTAAPGTKPTIKFENVIPTKNYVQSGTFAAVAPGKTTSFTFYAAKGQRLMFATMYSNSNDLFFAPENPGIQLFNDSGVPYTGNHCRCRETLGQRNPRKRTARPRCQSSGRSPGRRGNRSEGHGLRRTQLSGRIESAPGEPDFRCRTVAVHLYDLQYFGRHGE